MVYNEALEMYIVNLICKTVIHFIISACYLSLLINIGIVYCVRRRKSSNVRSVFNDSQKIITVVLFTIMLSELFCALDAMDMVSRLLTWRKDPENEPIPSISKRSIYYSFVALFVIGQYLLILLIFRELRTNKILVFHRRAFACFFVMLTAAKFVWFFIFRKAFPQTIDLFLYFCILIDNTIQCGRILRVMYNSMGNQTDSSKKVDELSAKLLRYISSFILLAAIGIIAMAYRLTVSEEYSLSWLLCFELSTFVSILGTLSFVYLVKTTIKSMIVIHEPPLKNITLEVNHLSRELYATSSASNDQHPAPHITIPIHTVISIRMEELSNLDMCDDIVSIGSSSTIFSDI